MRERPEVNREYRDRLFKFIFGNPENKEWTLSLYNAVNKSDYKDPDDISLNTIENAVYMSMKNDVSFLVNDSLNFYEQQSTFNPNMPMRFLIYSGMIYAKYIEENRSYRRYSSMQQKAPAPRCVCFYNGRDDKEDLRILKLSDSFDGRSDIELCVSMININYGHNKELLEMCRPLNDYARFVDSIRKMDKKLTLAEAVDKALEEMPDDSVIKKFLMSNKAEVRRMCITEYDEERTFADQRDEGREEGLEEGLEMGLEMGLEEGKIITLASLAEEGIISLELAAEKAGLSVEDFEKAVKKTKVTDNS